MVDAALDYPNTLPRPSEELAQLEAIWAMPKGWRIVTDVNNMVIGLFYAGTAVLFFLLAGILALLMRLQLAVPSNTFLSQDAYNQIFTMHGTVMMFCSPFRSSRQWVYFCFPRCSVRATCLSRDSALTRSGPIWSAD